MRRHAKFEFLLHIADPSQNSAQAVANPAALCRTHLPGRHKTEIVDVFKEPKRALTDGVQMTPTLIRLAPSPVRKIVGTLSSTSTDVETLGLEPAVAGELQPALRELKFESDAA